jgi:hypothetical protein
MNELATTEQTTVIQKNESVRHVIVQLESNIKQYNQEHQLAEPDCPLSHVFAPGAYARTIFIPKDTLLVGKIHKHAHLNMLMQGRVSVAAEEGPILMEAPRVMSSKAGTKRVVYTHTDTIWTTVHLTESTDLEAIEEQIIANTYEEFDALQDGEVLQLLPLVQQEEEL